jgi:fructose-1,6-bisphosphatase/inositol monophosphatase family enzyme
MSDNKIDPTKEIFRTVGKRVLSWRNDQSKKKLLSPSENKYYADLLAHELLVGKLTELYPGIPIISEEDFTSDAERPFEYWIIDPIDGTLSWVNGFNGFVSQGALMRDQRPVFSVVYVPCLDKTYSALDGCGFYINDKIIEVSDRGDEITLIDNTPEPHGVTRLVYNKVSASNYLESGSLGLKCCLVADGTANVFVKDVVVRDWDIAPAWLILNEAKCKISLTTGDEYLFSGEIEKNGIVVTSNEGLHIKVLNAIK